MHKAIIAALDRTLSDTPAPHHDIFSDALDAVVSHNPFLSPCNPPGARAHLLEQHLADASRLTQLSVDAQEKLLSLKQLLARSPLLHHERAAVFSAVCDFLVARGARPRKQQDPQLFLDVLHRSLTHDFHLPYPDSRLLLLQIRRLTLPSTRAA